MKLFFCPQCSDIQKMTLLDRQCVCGRSGGRYTDWLNALIWGDAIPLGIANRSFEHAVFEQKQLGDRKEFMANGEPWGRRFEAFVIPDAAPTIKSERVNSR